MSPEEIRNLLERVLFHEYDAMRVSDEEYREGIKYIRSSKSDLDFRSKTDRNSGPISGQFPV